MTATAAFTEAELIEMEHRLGKLQRAIENADHLLAARQSHFETRIAQAEDDLKLEGRYESVCRTIRAHERERDCVIEARLGLAHAVEAVQADAMVLLKHVRSGR